ncbi:MAG: hypothetical protein KGJ24_14075, partial [Burkholderiales bacterium]|nr:hypothetical protein [Burkholderiales bacterium]
QANPGITYLGRPPEPLLGIPVIEIELDARGQVLATHVLREPAEAKQVTAIALAAIRRAAPYGDMSHLPRPWKFVEVFLFDDAEHFKPATLDR